MKTNLLTIAALAVSLISCESDNNTTENVDQEKQTKEVVQPVFQNEAHELVYNMVQKVGNYDQLKKKGDVSYTSTYRTPDGKTDISIEKYLFDGELSYGKYTRHDRTLSNLEGEIEQGYDGSEFWLKNNGTLVNDEMALKKVAFNRPTNFYWFAMMNKLVDPGMTYEYVEEKSINNKLYDVVKVSFDAEDDKPRDIYQVYINQETHLVDQFLFTVMEFGKADPLLMQVEYVLVDGLSIPAKRKYKASTWNADVSDTPWVEVNWSDIKFGNGLTQADFKK